MDFNDYKNKVKVNITNDSNQVKFSILIVKI